VAGAQLARSFYLQPLIAWTRRYVDKRLDPLASPPVMPAEPEVRPEDLKPYLGGLSPYGPSGW
jgi:hypothetical protein